MQRRPFLADLRGFVVSTYQSLSRYIGSRSGAQGGLRIVDGSESLAVPINTQLEEGNFQCPICIMQINDNPLLLRCGHLFHESCAEQWRRQKDTCAVCRKKVEGAVDTAGLIEWMRRQQQVRQHERQSQSRQGATLPTSLSTTQRRSPTLSTVFGSMYEEQISNEDEGEIGDRTRAELSLMNEQLGMNTLAHLEEVRHAIGEDTRAQIESFDSDIGDMTRAQIESLSSSEQMSPQSLGTRSDDIESISSSLVTSPVVRQSVLEVDRIVQRVPRSQQTRVAQPASSGGRFEQSSVIDLVADESRRQRVRSVRMPIVDLSTEGSDDDIVIIESTRSKRSRG